MPPMNKKLNDLPSFKSNAGYVVNNAGIPQSYKNDSYGLKSYQPNYGGVMADLHNPAQGSGDQVSFPSIKSRGAGIPNNNFSNQRSGGYLPSFQNNSMPSNNKFGQKGNKIGLGSVG